MKRTVALSVVIAWARLTCGRLELPDQLNVAGGGYGEMVASAEAIRNELGREMDDAFTGELTFRWTMKWQDFSGPHATASWAFFNFFSADHKALSGIGNSAGTSRISTFNERGHGQEVSGHQTNTEIEKGREYTFTLVINYRANGPDIAQLSGGGFVDEPLWPGDWSFDHIRVRAGEDSKTRVDFTGMSIEYDATGGKQLEQVDPRFPHEWGADLSEAWSYWPWLRIRQLEAERDQLSKSIASLPRHHPLFYSSRLGYHASLDKFETCEELAALPPCQIDFRWNWAPLLDSIAWVPAFNPKAPGAYAFPKRFKIEVCNFDSTEFETVVDWMDQDFPDPGLYPVFFAGINRNVWRVRITIPQVEREAGMAYSALGEVYLLQMRPDGSTGANMALWGRAEVEVEASDSFSISPFWDVKYLYDGLVGLGFPLSDETVDSKDLMVVFPDGECPDKVQLVLDLGAEQYIGRIDFWPATPPAGLALPSFGFPREIWVELSSDPLFETVKVLKIEDTIGDTCRENILSVAALAYKARYLRVTMREFAEYKGGKILGLGEILVSEFETSLSTHCKITVQGIPQEYLDQLPYLVDECSGSRRILPQGEWIKGLAQRRPLDRRLVVVERELEQARVIWRITQQRIGIWGGSTLLALLLLGLAFQCGLRCRALNRLKWRIAQDLHDEVGSNLGSISLVAERLEHDIADEAVKEDLIDLALLARETAVSLRDVVWMVDQTTIRLPELMQKLAERAQRILREVELVVEIPPDCPNMVVSLIFKRNLIMAFKEAVHNCARHANATQVKISVLTKNKQLCVQISDNGCGFDPTQPKDGWGLGGMQKRAHELGGIMFVESQLGQGTTVEFLVPLKALFENTDYLYNPLK